VDLTAYLERDGSIETPTALAKDRIAVMMISHIYLASDFSISAATCLARSLSEN